MLFKVEGAPDLSLNLDWAAEVEKQTKEYESSQGETKIIPQERSYESKLL